MSAQQRPIAWSIAGSDSGAGAGLQADLRAFEAMGVHGCSAVAALTAQNSVAVTRIEAVSPDMLDAQLATLAADMPPGAIKTGMLGTAANVEVVARWVDRLRKENPKLALVVDPVLRATTGASFADAALIAAYRSMLLPRATLVTPNRREAAALLGLPALTAKADVEQAARALREAGSEAVAITGGDDGGPHSDDYLDAPYAEGWLRLPRVETPHHHGTGCTFAASAAAAMACGFVAAEAVVLAKMATAEALRQSHAAGSGAGPVKASPAFALQAANLPLLSLPGRSDFPDLHFAPLVQCDMGLYVIVDSAAWVARVVAAGVRTVQLRIKDPSANLRDEIRASIAAAQAAGAQLFINDHWQLALEEGAYGVHLGQEDLATADLRALADAGIRLGVSTHAYWEVCRARAIRPSYFACGPIHPTAAKAMPWIPQGNGNLAYWCRVLAEPVVAIAGMDTARAQEARARGAAGVALISAVTAAADPEGVIAALRAVIDGTGPLPGLEVPALARPTLAR